MTLDDVICNIDNADSKKSLDSRNAVISEFNSLQDKEIKDFERNYLKEKRLLERLELMNRILKSRKPPTEP